MGVIKARTGFTAAKNYFTKAMLKDPNNKSARFNLAILAIEKDPNKAKRLLFEVRQSTNEKDKLNQYSKALF